MKNEVVGTKGREECSWSILICAEAVLPDWGDGDSERGLLEED